MPDHKLEVRGSNLVFTKKLKIFINKFFFFLFSNMLFKSLIKQIFLENHLMAIIYMRNFITFTLYTLIAFLSNL